MREFILKLDDQQLAVLSEALGNMPLKIALPVLQELQKQINEQVQAAQVQPPKVDGKADELRH